MSGPSPAERYRRFAAIEAHGVSRIYENWALGIADDAELAALITRLPEAKRQPNLVFAVARMLGAPEAVFAAFRAWMFEHMPAVTAEAAKRSTQTNEPARTSLLLATLERIDGPIALLEVGASAGLCLYPDRYSHIYRSGKGEHRLDPIEGASTVALDCRIDDLDRAPRRMPDVMWRGGIDLNPLDVTSTSDMRWLEALIWPELDDRRARLRAAASIVAADPPLLVRGDLVDDLDRVLAMAPPEATAVVFHSAVLAYVPAEIRKTFASAMRERNVRWISHEGRAVLPDIAAQLPVSADDGRFVLALDGRPLALTGPHGQSLELL